MIPRQSSFLDAIQILYNRVDLLTTSQVHNEIDTAIKSNHKELVLNVNVNCINLSYQHKWLRDFLNQSKVVFCDGSGIMLGARILGHHIPERITYADWMWQLAEFAELRDFTFFFLGAKPNIADKAAARLKERFPNLKVVGVCHGYFDKTSGSEENEAVIERINAVKPNILVLGFGMPLQERWLMENWSRVEANIALTGGAVFDYVSGELQRAPRWMTDHGLEWLGRLLIEPRRLWRRYLIGNLLFLWRVIKQRLGLSHFNEH
ncbi:MAG: WecB/TagA/CpsF family glycosyltransferase [Planctomycetes bacterium]|nr:WecB/TagA/CpsF family glycosyltransferase [Planctomycetota bacterium]